MFFIKDAFAKVWSIDKKEKFAKVRIGTSEKNQKGDYVNSTWFASFVGDAFKKIDELEIRDSIKILKGKVSNVSEKQDDGTYKNYLNVAVFDFENANRDSKNDESEPDDDSAPAVEDDDLPF
jgi:hypothetical protein